MLLAYRTCRVAERSHGEVAANRIGVFLSGLLKSRAADRTSLRVAAATCEVMMVSELKYKNIELKIFN